MFSLCKHPEIQTKLRNEVSAVQTDHPSFEELEALPYLDAVVRETLRVHAPVVGTVRNASKDSVIPLSEPIIDKKGVTRHEILFVLYIFPLVCFANSHLYSVAKGTAIWIPILFMAKSALWGPDADEFNPERWLTGNVPEGSTAMPSINFPVFLAGPRACIGFRFSLLEYMIDNFSLPKF